MRLTEVAEPGGFEMDNQLPRLGYRGRYPARLNLFPTSLSVLYLDYENWINERKFFPKRCH